MRFIIPLLTLLTAATAFAQAPNHTHQGDAGKFYESWMRPDNRNYSCCNAHDCGAAEAHTLADGSWVARFPGEKDFVPIPKETVEHERDSPDGQNHLCKRESFPFEKVWCFIAGAGG